MSKYHTDQQNDEHDVTLTVNFVLTVECQWQLDSHHVTSQQ